MENNGLIIKTFENQMSQRVCTLHEFENVYNNRVFRIETESKSYIFKVFSSDWPEDGKLPFIERKLSERKIAHAKLHAYNRDNNFPNGYLIEDFLAGTTADKLFLSKAETIDLYEKLAVLLSEVHRIQMPGHGYIGKTADGTRFSEFMCDSLDHHTALLRERRMISGHELETIKMEMRGRLKKCDNCPPVLIHGDLAAQNIMVSDEISLIDWDNSLALCWVADIANLTLRMKHYGSDAEIFITAFLDKYETGYDKNLFYETEDILHVYYCLFTLNFFAGNANYRDAIDGYQSFLRDALKKCGMEALA